MNNKPTFKSFVCAGDTTQWTADGFLFVATVELDQDHEATEDECYDAQAIERWKNGEWFFCGVVVTVWKNGIYLSDSEASLWGIEVNFNDDNSYLAEVAAQLQAQATEEARKEIRRIQLALAD